jgi:hypothetical protein
MRRQRAGQVVVMYCRSELEANRPAIRGEGLVVPTQAPQLGTDVRMSIRIVPLEADRLAILGNGLIVLAKVRQVRARI